jgi:uncharacterized protein YndB with AHSA1/START domain
MKEHEEIQPAERAIVAQVTVPAGLDQVWEAWTTEAGARTFFAPGCAIDLRPHGRYEMFFDLDAPPGSRGGEGMIVLAVQPKEMLSFTWNSPPHLSTVRDQLTHVVIRLRELDPANTIVTLIHDGWGTGGEWDASFAYFTQAWKLIVLPRLRYRFAVGPIDWKNPPQLTPSGE